MSFNFGDSLSPEKTGPVSFGGVTSPFSSPNPTSTAPAPAPEPVVVPEEPKTSEEESADGETLPSIVPLVTLAKVDVVTGEEDEECVYEIRTKMYWWGVGNAGLQWKDRGVGYLKLLRHKTTKITRLLMRREIILKLCANHKLSEEMVLSPMQSSTKAWVYSCYADFSEPPDALPQTIAIRFKSKEEAEQFKEAFDRYRDENIKLGAGNTEQEQEQDETEEVQAATDDSNEEKEKAGANDNDNDDDDDEVIEITTKMASVSTNEPAPEKPLLKWAMPPQSYLTYDNDPAIGKPAPSLDTLEYVKGEPIKLGNGKVTCISFFAKFAKGDYTTVVGINELTKVFPDVQFLGISLDPCIEDALSFLGKIGTSMPEIYIDKLDVGYPLAWDKDKTVKESYRKVTEKISLTVSETFVIDATGTIVWREQFGQGHFPSKGQLGEQLRRVLAGEELFKNGNAEVQEEEEEEQDECVPDDYDSDLGF